MNRIFNGLNDGIFCVVSQYDYDILNSLLNMAMEVGMTTVRFRFRPTSLLF